MTGPFRARPYQLEIHEVTTSSGLDGSGFYVPQGWSDEELAKFSREIDPGADGPIDLGIVRAVKTLLDHGIETCQSCEGGEGHSYSDPTVDFWGQPGQPWRALGILVDYEFPVASIGRHWHIERDGSPAPPVWRVTFRHLLGPRSQRGIPV